MKQSIRYKKAFTLIELMVGIMAGSILSLTVVTLLVYGYQAWNGLSEEQWILNDAEYALIVIAQNIREAPLVVASNSEIQFYEGSVSDAILTGSVRLNGEQLEWRDGRNVLQEVLVVDGVSQFVVQTIDGGDDNLGTYVSIHFTIQRNGRSLAFSESYYSR